MEFLIIIVFIIFYFVLALLVLARREAQKHDTSTTEEFIGICSIALHRTVAKQANLEKIKTLFTKHPELANADIREATGLHRRAVVRYMTDLENEGFLEQFGQSGRGVIYRIK